MRVTDRSPTEVLVAAGRVVLLLAFTGVEVAALGLWLALVADAPLRSRATAVGFTVLVVGLLVEHFLTDLAVNGADVSFPLGETLAVSISEAALWAVWLAVAERVGGLRGILAAGVVLAVLLVPQHSVEDNSLRQEGLAAGLLDGGTVGFSLVEAAGATVWLACVTGVGPVARLAAGVGVDLATAGLAALAVALLVEHVLGVRFARRTTASRSFAVGRTRPS